MDKGLGASGSATLDGTKATVTYTTTGDAVTQASYVVTDAEWDGDYGWLWAEGEDGPTVLSYGRLGEPGSGTGTVDVPSTGTWGTDYHVYVLAEDVNGTYETDYASEPVKVGKTSEPEPPQPSTHKVTLTGGANATASGATEQDVEEGSAMADVTYAAKAGYHFEAFDPVTSNGVTARLVDGKVVVSGTLADDVKIAVPDAVADSAPEPAKVAKPSTSGHPGTGTIDVSWKSAKDAKSYEVQWRKRGGKWQTKAVKSRKYTISGLKKGALYEVRVRAKAGSVAGEWSPTARRWLRGPSSVKAKSGSEPGAVKVSWKKDKKATGGTKVYVYAKKGGKLVKTAKAEAGKTSATVEGLKAGKKHYVRVRPIRTASGKTYTGTLSGYKAVKAAK